ncbi:MAG: hypothetical protein N3G78_07430 [Desulfobacterota bacterium]|nr:hypothetical protein [Thermodesulfobacteriota bacterium]
MIGLWGEVGWTTSKELTIEGNRLVSQKPPFTSTVPLHLKLVHAFSHENPSESSLTRVYFYIAEKNKIIEEMFIVQIADKTNPQALPMTAPALKPYIEKRAYSKGKVKRGDLDIEYLIQLMAWNPEAKSLLPIVKKGWVIPNQWALQGQYQFIYLGEHGILVRYSKDINTFGVKVSTEGRDWERERLTGNEKKAYQLFQTHFMEMVNSIQLKN